MTTKLTIGVIFGAPSEEYEVSCMSAQTVVGGLQEAGYEVVAIGISRAGRWYAPVPLEAIATFNPVKDSYDEVSLLPRPGGTLYRLHDMFAVAELDAIFPIVHGKFGEDGRLQGLLDMCRLPYVGAGIAGSVVGMDKVYMRDILSCHGIIQTEYQVVMRSKWREQPEATLDSLEENLSYPLFVKPANGGSSLGISSADRREELINALNLASKYDRKLLVEKRIDKREIELAIMGNTDLYVSLPGEVLADQAFYDYRSKYESSQSRTVVPADLTPNMMKTIQETGKMIYRALDLWGLCRVDFFLEKGSHRLFLNEVNTIPGFTDISMYAKMWDASGKPLATLLDELVQLALEQQKEGMEHIIFEGDR